MAVATGAVHHLALTVKDTARSQAFYTQFLGFKHMVDLGPKVLMSNGAIVLAINPPPDPEKAIANDVFSEHRIGLDHLSFSVGSRADLDAAVRLFDDNGIPHGTINDLSPYGLPIYVLAFRDPDNIQLELTAPK
ncbi:MAG TPA: VOC family protein [Phototrophicaceae bacterium]|nr:VOC family protein [Phototrophicaceae bacterium]